MCVCVCGECVGGRTWLGVFLEEGEEQVQCWKPTTLLCCHWTSCAAATGALCACPSL